MCFRYKYLCNILIIIMFYIKVKSWVFYLYLTDYQCLGMLTIKTKDVKVKNLINSQFFALF